MLVQVGGTVRTYIGGSPAAGFKSLKPAGPPDAVVPAFGALAGKTTLTVEWLAPSEKSWSGPVAAYEIRYSTSPLNEGNFGTGTLLSGPPTPEEPETLQCARLSALTPCTTYYAAIKSLDHSGQWSLVGATAIGKMTRCSGTTEVDCQ
jgi:hypothetical protein